MERNISEEPKAKQETTQARKAGKHERIAKMLKKLVKEEPAPLVVDWLALECNTIKHLLLAFVLLTTGVAMGQEIHHAPTAEQCKADVAVWYTQVANVHSLSVRELFERRSEMSECVIVLESRSFNTEQATELHLLYEATIRIRESHFLERHNLTQQFMDEDATGAR